MKFARTSRVTTCRTRNLLGGRLGASHCELPQRRIVLRAACGRGFFFQRLLVYKRHFGPLLFQAQFHQRGKREAVEFITQHPVLVVSLVKIAVLLFVVMTAWRTSPGLSEKLLRTSSRAGAPITLARTDCFSRWPTASNSFSKRT